MLMKSWNGKGQKVKIRSVDVPWGDGPVFCVTVGRENAEEPYSETQHMDFAGACDRYFQIIADIEPDNALAAEHRERLAKSRAR